MTDVIASETNVIPSEVALEMAQRIQSLELECAKLQEELRKAGNRGKLTAEQVRDAWCSNLKRDCLYDPPSPDWQAIVDELNAAMGRDNRVAERLRGIAADMRGIGASSMTPRELFAYWAHEVDKAADLADFLGGGECEMVTSGTPSEANTDKRCTACGAYNIGEYYDGLSHLASPRFCPNCGKAVKR